MTDSVNEGDDRAARGDAARQQALAQAVARVESVLTPQDTPAARPVLVMMCGLPGTGKTYLARRLQPYLSATIVETDHVRHILFRQPRYTGAENAWVYAVCHALIARLLEKGHSVIFDATNLVERNREAVYHIADRLGAKLVIVNTYASDEVVRQRLNRRREEGNPANHSDADVEVYEKMRPTQQPIRRQHIAVDTTSDGDLALRRILRECRT